MKLIEIARFTEDVAQSTAFYRQLLAAEPIVASDDMAIFLVGETKIFVHRTYTPGEGDLPPENHIAFAVSDVDVACQRLAASGLTAEVGPKDYYWGRSAYLRAPDGQLIELTQDSA